MAGCVRPVNQHRGNWSCHHGCMPSTSPILESHWTVPNVLMVVHLWVWWDATPHSRVWCPTFGLCQTRLYKFWLTHQEENFKSCRVQSCQLIENRLNPLHHGWLCEACKPTKGNWSCHHGCMPSTSPILEIHWTVPMFWWLCICECDGMIHIIVEVGVPPWGFDKSGCTNFD